MNTILREPKCLNSVREFHDFFNHPISDSPSLPLEERSMLRVSLIQEELDELKEAIVNKDIVSVADALADIQYVLSGTVLEFGMGEKFGDLFDEVHSSNMSKSCASLKEAEETVEFYKREKNIDCKIVQKGDKYLVFRTSDNKVLKNIYYRKADLKKIINQ